MKIEFTEEQGMLLETATAFCRQHSPIARVRARLDADDIDRSTWDELTALGWLGVNVAEQYGGLAMGLGATAPIIEAMGRHLMGSPFGGQIVAAETLAANASESQKQLWLPQLVSGTIATVALTEPDGNWRLDEVNATATDDGEQLVLAGTKSFVTDADAAALILVSLQYQGATRLLLLEADQVARAALSRETVIDQTRRSFALTLDGLTVPAGQLLPGTDLAATERSALLVLSAEIAGGLAGVLPLIVDYLNTRKAFGRAIGSYQSLKHPTADILLSLESARSHLYAAASAVDGADQRAAEVALRIAKAQGCAAFAFAGDRAVQFHGGFGFTFECDAQLYLRRALWCQYQFGDEHYHQRLLEPLLLDDRESWQHAS